MGFVIALVPLGGVAPAQEYKAQHGDRTGDVIELETEGLGRLRFNVRDDLKRTWARETRLERQENKLEPATTPQLSGKYTPSPKTTDRAG
jgi:hypothetical protein